MAQPLYCMGEPKYLIGVVAEHSALSLQVVARVEPDERFTRYGADLRANLNITLAEALAGFTRDFQLLNGGTVLLNRTRVRDVNSTGFEKGSNWKQQTARVSNGKTL